MSNPQLSAHEIDRFAYQAWRFQQVADELGVPDDEGVVPRQLDGALGKKVATQVVKRMIELEQDPEALEAARQAFLQG